MNDTIVKTATGFYVVREKVSLQEENNNE